MNRDNCDYNDVMEEKKICALKGRECTHAGADCETSEEYWKYLEAMGVDITSRAEIEESLDDAGTVQVS